MNKGKQILALALAALVSVGGIAGCSAKPKAKKDNTAKPVSLSMYLYGSESPGNKAVMDQINAKLKKDLNASLTIKYIDWNDIATKYPLLFASGEKYDMVYISNSTTPTYATAATQGSLADITDLLSQTPTLKSTIPDSTWNQAKVNGKIYAVPCVYTEYTPYGFVSNDKLLKKYGLGTINSVAGMEAYMDAVVKNEKFAPLNGDSNLSQALYTMFVQLHGSWIQAPGVNSSEPYLVASSASNYKDIISPVFTQEFEDFAVLMKQWADKGYWPKDILSAQKADKDNFNEGNSGAFITHMPDWTGNFGTLKSSQPGVTTSFFCFATSTKDGVIVKTPGIANSTAISKDCSDPARALKVIEKLLTDKSYYDLFQYGIEGKQYEVQNGLATTPAGFNQNKDGFGFAGWALRNDKLNIPYASEDPRRYQLINDWNKTSIANPFASFNFDTSNISSQLAAVSNVDSTMGIQILLGKSTTDPKTAVAKYRAALKSAGIDDIINAVKQQLGSFTPAK